MIRKTVKEHKRFVKSWNDRNKDKHIERVIIETWWFLFIPLYSRQTILATNL